MKKILAWVLVLVLLLGMLAGCRQRDPEPEKPIDGSSVDTPVDNENGGPTADEAMEYLRAIYKDTEEPTPTPVNYDRYGIVRIAGVPFTVVWTVDVGEDLIQVVVNEDGSVTIDVNETCEVATPYTLTATITDEYGNSASHSWDMILPAAVDMVEIVKAAYALEVGASLPYQSTLRGEIVAINTVYSAEYKNITVTIAVEGAEDMPIMCYRLKGEGIEDLAVGNIITVTGTLKNYSGTIEFDAGCTLDAWEKGNAQEAITDPGEILKAAYALKEDTQLPNPATLTGTVIEIDSPYDPNYGNISVVIEVEGYPQYPMLCYRMKGVDVSKIAVNDLITVTGIIKNYKGKIEFDAGCQMIDRVSGGGVAQGPSSDQDKILSDAAKLGVGEKLPYIATLTGEIYSVDSPYDAGYGNITVTIMVGGKKIQCYRMVGDGIDQIRETDTITVTGIIENYNGKLEFGAKSQMVSWTKGPRNVNYGPLKEETAYRLYVKNTGLEKTLYFTGSVDGSRLNTSVLGSEGVDIYVERVSGKGVRFYFMDGSTKTYIGVEDYLNNEGKTRGRAVVGANVSSVWTYDSTEGIYVSEVQAGKHFLGTYGTYETITASWIGYLESSTSTQYKAKFMLASDVPADDAPALAYGTYTTSPEVGVAYKLGLDQTTKEATYYFTGAMSTYYGATDTDYAKGVDVYLETAEGGYYLYFNDASGAKQYVYIVANGTHMNFTFNATDKSVFVYDTELNSLYTTVDGSVYYMGTYSTYVTVGTTAAEKAATSYVTHLYTSGTGGNGGVTEPDEPDVPVVPDEPATEVTELEENEAYNMMMAQVTLDKTLYLAGGLSGEYWTTTEDASAAASVYVEKDGEGYHFYYLDGETKVYIEAYLNSNGKPRPQMSSTPTQVWTYNEEVGVFTVEMNGQEYYMGTYGTYETISVSSTYYITGDKAANKGVSQFYVVFVDPNASETPDTPVVPDEPTPETGKSYLLGSDITTSILYFNGSTVSGKSYYLDVTTDSAAAAQVYLEEVTGGYLLYFMDGETKTYIRVYERTDGDAGYGKGSLELTTTAPAEVLTIDATTGTLIYTADADNAYYIGTYYSTSAGKTYENLSVSNTYYITGDNAANVGVTQFPVKLYEVAGSEGDNNTGDDTTTETGKSYLLGSDITTSILYFNGSTVSGKSYYLDVTTDSAAAAQVYLEEVTGGYLLYFMDGETKTYIRVYERTDGDAGYGKGSLELTTTAPAEVLTIDATTGTLIYTADADNAYYIGTYYSTSAGKTYENLSVSNTYYITGDNAANVGVTQFPVKLYEVAGSEGDNNTGDDTSTETVSVVTIAEARDAEAGTEVTVKGVVASITYAYGMNPDGVILVDDTASIYVYGKALASQVAVGNTVTLTATKAYYILESEQSNAAKFGYTGCNQLDNATVVELDTSVSQFSKSWIEETTVKEIMETSPSEDITTLIYKVTALVKKAEGTGFTNYYIDDLDGETGSYVYTKCSGSDFAWLDAYDGKICTVYLTALNAKSSASGCIWRFQPVEVKNEGFDVSTVNFAENAVKYYAVDQFLPEYTGDPAMELLTSVSNELLGYTDAKLSYVSSDPAVISIEENVMHCLKTGTAVITVTAEHNGVTYSEDVTITVDIFDVDAEYPTVAEAVAADLDATVTVKGVVGPSLVNKTGFYLIDDTGVIAVLVDDDTLATLEIGYEVVLEGTREYHSKSGSSRGNSCLNNTKVLYNGYGSHAYSTASFDGELTLAEFAALSVDTDHTTDVYIVTATVEVVETAYYTSIKLVDGETSINLYSSSANQYSWLKEYAGQEITMELAPCNWSSKSVYPACVLAVLHEDGTKTVNSLNFN